jgi:hypothetical protein
MYAVNGSDVLDFNINFKVTRKVRRGFLGLQSTTDELVILNDGKQKQRQNIGDYERKIVN